VLHPKPLPVGKRATFTAADIVRDPETRATLDAIPYAQTLCRLGFVAQHTRPDISEAVSLLQGFLTTYSGKMIKALEHLLGYVKQTRHFRLEYHVDGSFLAYACSDASWAADQIDRRSRSGIIVFVFGMAVYWASRKQTAVTISSFEGETVSFTDTSKEVLWLRRVLEFLGFDISLPTPIIIDNAATEAFATTAQVTSRTKHIDIKHFFNKQHVLNGDIVPVHAPTTDEIADILTKLPGPLFDKFRDQILGHQPKTNLNQYLQQWLRKFSQQQRLVATKGLT
jgi:hypothetical protein